MDTGRINISTKHAYSGAYPHFPLFQEPATSAVPDSIMLADMSTLSCGCVAAMGSAWMPTSAPTAPTDASTAGSVRHTHHL